MLKLYNLGCSFAYGNCVPTKNELCDTHISPGTLVAKHLGLEEVNLASNGNSLDGVLRTLYTHEFEKGSVILIGVPPAGRFQVITEKEQYKNKQRTGKSSLFGGNKKAEKCIKYAYTKGPDGVSNFYSIKWASENIKHMEINETASYLLYFNLIKIQSRLKELGLSYYIYNSIKFSYKPINPETNLIKDQIDLTTYYKPESDMFAVVKSNPAYELADGDQHPNHIAYEVWAKDFCSWMDKI